MNDFTIPTEFGRRSAGRPSGYSEELADIICERMMDGRSLRQVCQDADMPDRSTVLRWLERHPEFATKCARARDFQGDVEFDKHGDLLVKVERGDIDPHSARVIESGIRWRAMKLAPKKYGDQVKQILTGPDDKPIQIEDARAHLFARLDDTETKLLSGGEAGSAPKG